MLRGEHVMAHLRRGFVVPHRLSPEDGRALEAAGKVCRVYASHLGRPRRELEEALSRAEEEAGPRLDPRRGFRVVRALAKLLEERSGWAPPTDADPYTVRTRIFELAAAMPELPASEPGLLDVATREEVLAQVSRETGLEDPSAVMYADRQAEQILANLSEPSPEELIARYNTAQVQGVLYSARELVVDLGREADARTVFGYVKLLGLIYRLEITPDGYRLHLDGPLSIFSGTRRYGLRIAKFLPALLLTSPWRLSADVTWRGREARLELDSKSCDLESHYAAPEAAEEEDLRSAFRTSWERTRDVAGWELDAETSIIPLPELGTALVPDFTLRRDEEEVYLEILGFWSRRHLVERVHLVREAAKRGKRVLVAASERLSVSPEALSEAAESGVIPFKGRLRPADVLERL
ncbi:MAG: DUF790 family protein [Rubrobacteraceae bacterium]|nr:DUF790 family protein [Rubrobacteraceae bacterium]